MERKIKVTVLMGGNSSEYDISIMSGNEVVKNLDKTKYETIPLVISREGKGIEKILKDLYDVVFIAMHGACGEDGTIQGMLELIGIPYTGSRVLASAIGMDKEIFRKLMRCEKLPIPRYLTLHKGQEYPSFHKLIGKMPYFVKPVNGGSSIGASIACDESELKKSIKLAFKYDDRILIDEDIDGIEVTCGVIGNNTPIALPIVEIIPLKGKFFDYESKYTESGSEEIVPARISDTLTKKVQKIAIDVYKSVGCKGFGRIDFILKSDRSPVILEINTIPGLTPMSLMPKAAKAIGISYASLLDKIIRYALEK